MLFRERTLHMRRLTSSSRGEVNAAGYVFIYSKTTAAHFRYKLVEDVACFWKLKPFYLCMWDLYISKLFQIAAWLIVALKWSNTYNPWDVTEGFIALMNAPKNWVWHYSKNPKSKLLAFPAPRYTSSSQYKNIRSPLTWCQTCDTSNAECKRISDWL